MSEKEYNVRYEITVYADGPIDAAVMVKSILSDIGSGDASQPVLDVTEHETENAETVRVDFEKGSAVVLDD